MKLEHSPIKQITEYRHHHKNYANFEFRFDGKTRKIQVSGRIKTDHAQDRVNAVFNKIKHKIEHTDGKKIKTSKLEKIAKKELHHKSDLKQFHVVNVKKK